ncbi:MAG: sodium/proton antiporter NhaB [Pseudomonadales bacterium]|nr:sodium/proton antiporter NhaB [Pseudomonadales bacterium]MBO6565244.1 sodium/proton antiporter NhaB [Pseudomonadales bacterium]MBO6595065.1 sodium/proton antiporter NhaB [Pseudomonadales bacterium]MBO6658004.1 sodium/proton antiporter NhaB [Pseudomonadales bacterium]MBO6821376.1 sodium/proton antiporter NhaB [Pseudomonadales bacterium]
MIRIAYNEFLGNSPQWFKNAILLFLLVCVPLKFLVGDTILGWLFLLMFILTLAMALKCYPLQSGGILALAILALGLTTPDTVWHEIQANLGVLALLIFMVSFIYFMKPLLSFLFARLIVGVQSKVLLSLMFSVMAAFLSAFLDALTVTAVLIAVFVALYGVYERIHSTQNSDLDHDGGDDPEELGGDVLENFRSFIRSLVMHGAVGTALGGVTTMVGEPQNLLIADKLDWEFVEFVIVMSHVTIPAVIAGFITCVALEFAGVLGYGQKLDPRIREILRGYVEEEDKKRQPREVYGLWVQGACGVLLVIGLGLHLMEVGLIGLSLLVLVTAMTGINEEHRIGHAFEESLPFVSLLCIFFVVVGMIHDLHLFSPVIQWVLTMPIDAQPGAFFLANGLLSAISDNVFVATVYINEVKAAFDAGEISREHFESLAVSINTGTNLPSVATPNGQAAFLFLLTSALAPVIRLGYIKMVVMAFPYTVVLTIVGYLAQ